MINRVFKNIKVLIISIVFAILFCVNASAFSTNLKEIKVLESNFEVTDPVIEGNNITNNITFNNKDDYVVFELTLKNNDNIKYTIDSIEDNNTNKNLVLSYDYQNKIVDKNSEFKVKVKLHYKNRLENVERIDLNNIKITINMISDDGKSSNIIVNPTTGDSILKYLVLLIIALSGLIIKQKKKSIGKVLIVLPILFLPFVIFANQKYKQEITFNSVTIKGEFLPYNITINIPGQDPIIKTITYGDEIGELPDVDIEGYTFDGWEDNKGNKVDEHTKVTGEIEISPKLTPIEYNITYDLNGGTALNPTKYTIEDKITLKNPVKEGYNFSGWTGSNGETLQTEVIINKGTTGNLNYIAHYSKSDTTPYKVIHRKQKLTLDGYDVEETDNLSGTTDSTVRPQTKNYTGFISPEETDLVITGDGKATLTYDYNRIIYTIDMDNLEDMTSNLPSGDYPYGTEVILTPDEKDGYDFDGWNDGNTDNPRTINIDGPITIKPTYKPKTDTPYKVTHKFQNIDLVTYTDEVESKTGTTGENVTPGVKEREGFISPNTQTGEIKGDGTTEFIYVYNRETYEFVIDDSEDVISSKPSGNYPYGTEIELEAKEKDGYTFDGWNDGNKDNPRTIVVGDNTTIKPIYKANTNTKYVVNHYKQNITLDGYDLADTDNLTGTTGATVTPSVRNYEGFISPDPVEATIKADGSLVVTYNYNRETYEFVIEDTEDVISSKPSGNYPYGTEVELTAKEKEGYTFDGWNDGNTDNPRTITIGDNTSVKPIYKPNTNTKYVVNHYKQNVTLDGYDLVDTDNLTGTTDTKITPAVKDYEGFTAPVPTEVTIKADGSLVVTYNYTRNTYSFEIEDNEDVISSKPSGNYPYGTEITLEAKDKAGYDFKGWSDGETTNPRTITVNGNTTISPVYTSRKDTAYKVEHKKQNLTGSGYTTFETELLTGETNKEVTPSVKTYEGFTSPSPKTVTIKGDGTTVVEYLYTRNSYDFNYSSTENIDLNNSTPEGNYPYETEITIKAKEKDGYTFSSWSNGDTTNPTTFELTGDITISPNYTANKYNVVFNSNGGSGSMPNQEMTYDKEAKLNKNIFTREGYTFAGWNTKADGTGTSYDDEANVKNLAKSGNIILYAIWAANTDTPYKVIHRYQNLDLETYDEVVENKTGMSDTKVTPPVIPRTGFVSPTEEEITIKADGTTVLNYNYTRNTYEFVIEDSEDVISSKPSGNYPYGTEIELEAKEKEGYTFDGWNDGNTDNPRTIVVGDNTTIKPIYKPNTNTKYVVNHYKQKVTLDGYDLADTDNLEGTTGAKVTPAVKDYEGFTAPVPEEVTIKADGSLVVTYNYTRKTYEFVIDDSEDVISSLPSGNYPYGTEITLEAKDKAGYDFEGWSDGETTNPRTITVNGNTTISPVYTSRKDTAYKVEHKKQNLNGSGYTVADTELLTGETGKEVTPSVKTYEGFTSPTPKTVTIKGDGTTVVEYLYTRNSYDFNYSSTENIDLNNSTPEGNYPYGTEITIKAKDKDGYTFSSWSNGDTTNPTTFELTGDITISPNYEANKYNVVFNSNGGSGTMPNQEMTYDKEAKLNKNIFTREGYTFAGWNTKADGTGTSYDDEANVKNLAKSGNIILYAKWNPNDNTSYTVNHYKQTVDKSGYVLADTDNLTGTTDSVVTPETKSYTGFISPSVETITITGDGRAVLNYNYDRVEYDFTLTNSEYIESNVSQGKYPYETDITITAKEKTGYHFSNFNDNILENPYSFKLTENKTFTVNYEPNTYNVVFNSNGGSGSMNNEEFTYDVKQKLSKNGFNRTGYTFNKWNTSSDGTGTSYLDEEEVENLTTSGNYNLYALWNANELIFNGDDTISKVYSTSSQEVTITGASNGTGSYTYTEVSEKKDNVDTDYITIDNTTITLSSSIPAGVYTYIVKATDTNSGSEKNATFVVTITKQKSDEVTNLNVTPEGIVSFTNSSNADGYLISIDGINYTPVVPGSGTTSVNYLDQITGSTGNRTVYVKATNSDGDNYEVSDPVTKDVTVYTLSTSVNNDEYGTISTSSTNVISGVTYTTSDNTLTLSDTRTVTTSKKDITGYTTTFTGWSSESGTISQNTSVTANYTRTINKYTLTINSNGGTITPTEGWIVSGDTATKEYDYNTTISSFPEVTKSGYVLAGYNTKQDGTGDNITTETAITNETTIYPQWIEARAMFDMGLNVNTKMKKLAGNSSATYSSKDTNITSIQKSSTRPDISSMTSDNIVSISNTTYNAPIYMWYDNGTIYWWSEDESPSLNQDSSYMFNNLEGLTNIDLSAFDTSNVTSMWGMFEYCTNLSNINFENNFNTSSVTKTGYMFASCRSLTSLDLGNNFDTSSVTNMSGMFNSCSSLTSLDLGDKFDTSNVTNMSHMFTGCSSLTSLDLGDKFDTSNETNMENFFYNCSSLTSLDLGDKFDTSNVTNMAGMFDGCISLISIDLGDKFDTGNVKSMQYMFRGCSSLISLDLGDKFDTSNVTNMNGMFRNCSSLTSLNLNGNFDTSKVKNMLYMFNSCSSLETIYATSLFVTTSVTTSNTSYMFTDDTKLVGGMGTTFDSNHTDATYAHIDGGTSNPGYFTDKSSINIRFDANGGEGTMNDQVVQYNEATPLNENTFTKSGYLFVGWNTKSDGTGTAYVDGANIQAKSLTTLYAQWIEAQAMFDTGQNLNAKMKKLAGNASATSYTSDANITSIQKSTTRPDISSMTSDNIVSISNTTYNAPIYMWYDNGTIYWWSEDNNPSLNQNSSDMFRSLTGLTNIDVTSFDTSNVTDMAEMFDQCSSLIELDVSSFNTSNVTKMYGMFEGCSSLTSLNLGENFNTNKVITMSSMFEGCSSLTSLDLGDKFDTSNVTNMESMFSDCSSLTNLNLGENFDTSNVTRMSYMFYGCSSLTSIDLGDKFDTSNVTGMYSMFRNCSSLTSIDLSNFNTNKVTGMRDMFNSCSRLETIYASNSFVTTSVTSSDNMFTGDTKLVGGMGTIFSSSHIDKEYAHIDGGTSNPGYFTDKTNISIRFNSNGGEGTMSDQVVQYDVATPLNANTFTREGYIFSGWNSAPDRSGTAYADGANIQAKSLTTLYAQWIEARAMFDTGASVNTKMKKLAGNASVLSFSSDTNITSIQKSSTKPDISSMTSDNIVSTSTLYIPIYMWYDNGTIYWWSEDDTPYLNTDSSDMFSRCSSLTSLDLSNFDTSKVTNMNNMFRSCRSLTSLDVSKFDTSNVTNMSGTFRDLKSLTKLDVSSFDTSNVTSMPWMFSNCKLLTKLDVSKFDTSKVTNMSYMFSYCSNLTNLNIGDKFDTSEVTNMSYMFSSCSNLTNLNIGDKFDTSKVTNMQMMFQNCSSLTILDLGDKFDTSNVTNMSGTFRDLKSLTKLDVSSFDTSNVTDMSWMFLNCSSLTSLDISSFDTGKVTTMQGMFDECVKITTLDLSTFDTKNVTNMSAMFWDCKSLTKLDVSSFDTSNVTDMGLMFKDCSSLTSLDLSSFDTSNVTQMSDMFCSCSRLTNLDLSLFDTSEVTNMNNMFQKCSSLTTLRLGAKFDTSNVTTMISMFENCRSLTSLDLSSFDTSKVTNISWMFQWMDNITTIYASDLFAISSVTDSIAVFSGDKKLVGGSGTKYSSSITTDATYARIDRSGSPGYFTYKAAPTGGNISRFINAFSSLNSKISKYVLGVFVVIALILSTVLLIIRSIKKRKIRKC